MWKAIFTIVIVVSGAVGLYLLSPALGMPCLQNSRCVFNDCTSKAYACNNRPAGAICRFCDIYQAFPICTYINDPLIFCKTVTIAGEDCGKSWDGTCSGGQCSNFVKGADTCLLFTCTTL